MSAYSTNGANTISNGSDHSNEKMLKSLLQLLHDVIPLVDQIRDNLHETSMRVPDVAKQLNSVSEATETATVEILNVLETMTESLATAQRAVVTLKKNEETNAERFNTLEQEQPELVASATWREFVKAQDSMDTIAQIENALAQTNDASLSISMALQVQDITSQQIAGANHLIEQVEEQLRTALIQFEASTNGGDTRTIPAAPIATTSKPVAFDSSAIYSKSTVRQEEADRITQQFLGT